MTNEIMQSSINPFASAPVAAKPSGTAPAMTDQSRAIAEVQAAMVIARMNPRDPIQSMDRILNACTRPTLASVAVYQYARGGSDITGPSIRLAEAIAQAWGNIQFGIRELEQRNGESTVQAFAWDVETNTRREVTFHVPHTRHTKRGSYKLEDSRDIYEMVANQGARRLRACILAVIPGDVTEAAVNQCEATMKAKADTSPDAIKKMLAAFEGFGVSKEQIEKRIQRRIDAIQPAQVVAMQKIYISMRDGMSVAADWFETVEEEESAAAGEEQSQNKTATEKLKASLQKKQQRQQQPEAPAAHESVDTVTGEVRQEAVTPPAEETAQTDDQDAAQAQQQDGDPTAEYNRAMQRCIADIDSRESLSELKWWWNNHRGIEEELGGGDSEWCQAVREHLNGCIAAMEKKQKGGRKNEKYF